MMYMTSVSLLIRKMVSLLMMSVTFELLTSVK